MLDTSKDLLNVVSAFSIGIVALMLAWGLYYIAMIVRQVHLTIRDIKEEAKSLRAKLEKTASIVSLFAKIADEGISLARAKKRRK